MVEKFTPRPQVYPPAPIDLGFVTDALGHLHGAHGRFAKKGDTVAAASSSGGSVETRSDLGDGFELVQKTNWDQISAGIGSAHTDVTKAKAALHALTQAHEAMTAEKERAEAIVRHAQKQAELAGAKSSVSKATVHARYALSAEKTVDTSKDLGTDMATTVAGSALISIGTKVAASLATVLGAETAARFSESFRQIMESVPGDAVAKHLLAAAIAAAAALLAQYIGKMIKKGHAKVVAARARTQKVKVKS